MTAQRRRPVLLLIDVEPDARKTSGTDDGWKSSEVALDLLERLRGELEAATGSAVRLNWFIRCDPQIATTWGDAAFAARACPRIMRTIERHHDSAGIHVHLWRWDKQDNRWSNDFRDESWIAECLDTSVAAFAQMFGEHPESCRFGDRWLSHSAVGLMRAAGIRFDLTVEPGLPGGMIHDDPHANGELPDFRAAPRAPWVASGADYLKPSPDRDGSPWMIPLTTTAPALRLVRRSPWLMFASRSPNLSLSTSYMWPHLRKQLDRPSDVPLVIVFRSGDLEKPAFMRNFRETTRLFARHHGLAFCDFTGPGEAIARWSSRAG